MPSIVVKVTKKEHEVFCKAAGTRDNRQNYAHDAIMHVSNQDAKRQERKK